MVHDGLPITGKVILNTLPYSCSNPFPLHSYPLHPSRLVVSGSGLVRPRFAVFWAQLAAYSELNSSSMLVCGLFAHNYHFQNGPANIKNRIIRICNLQLLRQLTPQMKSPALTPPFLQKSIHFCRITGSLGKLCVLYLFVLLHKHINFAVVHSGYVFKPFYKKKLNLMKI
jgi:hypothetical protein